MSTNIDRAEQMIESSLREAVLIATDGTAAMGFGTELGDQIGEESSILARALADAGLLAPDLPEANDSTIFVPGGKGWLLDGPESPVVWTAPGGLVMVQRIEPGELTPEQARVVASHLLAAADHAEEVDTDDQA